MKIPEGVTFFPPEKYLQEVCEYSRSVIVEDFEGEQMEGIGCWICACFDNDEPEVISQIPRDVLLDADMRNITFNEVVPQMIRESSGKAFSFLVPMLYSTPNEPRQFAVRVMAFNGFQLVDFFSRGVLDDDSVFSITGWGTSSGTGGVGTDLIQQSQRSLYKVG